MFSFFFSFLCVFQFQSLKDLFQTGSSHMKIPLKSKMHRSLTFSWIRALKV